MAFIITIPGVIVRWNPLNKTNRNIALKLYEKSTI